MTPEEKIVSFEYLVDKFVRWFEDLNPDKPADENFSKLKLLKLHFFVCAVTADSTSLGLLKDFDNFYALPYGHVESNIYDSLERMRKFTLGKNSIERHNIPDEYFANVNKEELDSAVELLRKKNKELVNYSPIELVELSHSWHSWISIFNMARQFDKFSMKIPVQLIQNEPKIFSLS